MQARAATQTSTTLAVTSAGAAVTTVKAGSVVTLKASVRAGSTGLKVGQVEFCDATAKFCTDIHLLGTAQLTKAGTAALKFRPGLGKHSYKAVFLGTEAYSGSSSSASALGVTGSLGSFGTSTEITGSGVWGSYTLSGTVSEVGGAAAPTGTVSFLDTSHGNAVTATGTLGASTPGLAWVNSQTLAESYPGIFAVGDFNGDGILDFAVPGSSALTVYLGNGDGTFTATTPLSTTNVNPNGIAAGDFNGDGIADLAISNTSTDTVAIFLGHGDGTFTQETLSASTGPDPAGLVVGDFNGDGIADLAVANENNGASSTVTLLLGKGDGTFTAVPTSSQAGAGAYAIVAADFNGDGKTDLAITAEQDETLTILLGNGDGTFVAAASPAVTYYCTTIALADLNIDGKPDLVVGCSNGGLVAVLLGNGDGTFSAAPPVPVDLDLQPNAIVIQDFNGDGIPDLAVLEANSTSKVAVFLGNGDSTFARTPVSPAAGYFPLGLTTADFNGDGRPDLAIFSNSYTGSLVYLTEPTESATATADVSLPLAGQHLIDAAYSGDANYTASVSASTPLWGVPPMTVTTLTLTSNGTAVTSVKPGGQVLLTARVIAGTAQVTKGVVNFCDASASLCSDIHLLGTAALNSGGTATLKLFPGVGVHSYKADFVQDGYGLASSSSTSTLTVGPAPKIYSNATAITANGLPGDYSLTATVVGFGGSAKPTGKVSFLDTSFGNKVLNEASLGQSTAGVGWLTSQTPAVQSSGSFEVVGDFNGDGIPDLALSSTNSSTGTAEVTVLLGMGNGAFKAGPTISTPVPTGTPLFMLVGDFNGDGKNDVALLNFSIGNNTQIIAVLLGNGDGSFTPAATTTVVIPNSGGDYIPGMMVAADFNGDGKLDLAIAGDYVSSGGVTILLGNGDGTFTPIGAGLDPSADFGLIATGDFNGDGIPDLIATNYFEDGKSPTIFLGKGDGTFTSAPASFTLDYFPTSVVTGDLNGDGKLDLAFSDLNGVEIVLGNGDGTFTETATSPIRVPSEIYGLTAGDFNQDGKLDLVAIDSYDARIVLLNGNGDGSFSVTETATTVSQNWLGPYIVSADFNGDGVPDVGMLTKDSPTASIYLTEPTETATATVQGVAPVGAGTHNVEAKYLGDSIYKTSVSATIPLTAGLAPPVFSLKSGTYTSVQTLKISEAIPGATIYYLASGGLNTNGFIEYKGPITLSSEGPTQIQAYATESGYQQSSYVTANYVLELPPTASPVLSLAPGSYSAAQKVKITDAAAGAKIYYTTNGAQPTLNSTLYTEPITVSTSETVVASAIAFGYSMSPSTSAQYLIDSSSTSFIYSVAGNGSEGYSGDNGPAPLADLNYPTSAVFDSHGNLYIADLTNNRVRMVAAGTGLISTIAGTGVAGYSGDNGPATAAQLNNPAGLAIDAAGNLYIADYENNVVRKIIAGTGTIITYAGDYALGPYGALGDGGPATAASLGYPSAVAFDPAGNLYIACSVNRIRMVATGTGIITTVAGTGNFGYTGDLGPATAASMAYPSGIATDSAGNVYIADTYNNVIRKITVKSGVITTVAGNGFDAGKFYGGYSGDGGPATSAELYWPQGVTVDAAGNIYISDTYNQAIRKVTAATGIINTVAGDGVPCESLGGDGGPATSAALCYPRGASVDSGGNLFVADADSSRIRKVTSASHPSLSRTTSPKFSISAGTYSAPVSVGLSDADPGAAIYVTIDGTAPSSLSAGYHGPIQVAGSLVIKAIAVSPGHLPSAAITANYKITSPPPSVISTIAGTGVSGFTKSGGKAVSAQVGLLSGVAVGSGGQVYFADQTNNVVWMLSTAGEISVVAGNGTAGNLGNGGPATQAQLDNPGGIALDSAGNLYIADTSNNVIRKVTLSTGLISTVAGNGEIGSVGNWGDGGPATDAQIAFPGGVTFDSAGNMYIADTYDNVVRRVSAATGIITTIAGTGTEGFSGDGGVATSANLDQPSALAIDQAGNLYIEERFRGRVRKVSVSSGIISTVAGNGDVGTSGDNGPATSAEIMGTGLALDSSGNLYISDSAEIREVSATTGLITQLAGSTYQGISGDGGSAADAEIDDPQGIAFDSTGRLYIADSLNFRVRRVSFSK